MSANSLTQLRRLKWLLGLLLVLALLKVAVTYKSPALAWLRKHRPALAATSRAAVLRHPNLVLISLDTVRPDHLGCYGYAKPITPNLDRFAATATRFTNSHCQAPWTLLSHMSLFTSKVPSHNGVDSIDTVLPPGVATLAQLLGEGGYNTAAIVHNGQMQAHWGFDRGFNLWHELDQKTGQATADHVTGNALAWLAAQPHEPYFLFLHYFDAHAPYWPPPTDRSAAGPQINPRDTFKYMVAHRFPDSEPVDADHLDQIEGAYDNCINFLDDQVGRVLKALPADTAVVIFSDHGEAFREHGRFGHGTSLFEEETRTALLVRLPGQAPQVINQPVMLMDIAPTLLSLAGVAAPADFEGRDLLPVIGGGTLEPAPIPAETRLPIERFAGQSFVLWPWKAIASNIDGSRELYLLPDETNNLAAKKSIVGQSLFKRLDDWAQERDYWVLYAKGPGAFSIQMEPTEGMITSAVASEQPPSGQLDDLLVLGRQMTWVPTPGPRTKMVYIQLSNPNATLRLNIHKDGKPAPADLRLGPSRHTTTTLPVVTNLAAEVLRPLVDQPAVLERDGVLAMRYRGALASGEAANTKDLDAQTIERLRGFGYLAPSSTSQPHDR